MQLSVKNGSDKDHAWFLASCIWALRWLQSSTLHFKQLSINNLRSLLGDITKTTNRAEVNWKRTCNPNWNSKYKPNPNLDTSPHSAQTHACLPILCLLVSPAAPFPQMLCSSASHEVLLISFADQY